MGWTQLGLKLSAEETASLVHFLKSLTGTLKVELPRLPPSTPSTPKPLTDIE